MFKGHFVLFCQSYVIRFNSDPLNFNLLLQPATPSMRERILPKEFYQEQDVTRIAQQLLGKVLYTSVGGQFSAGMIVETEAYSGVNDMACHACRFGKTGRTEVMFREGGFAYVYLCYGIHHLFNIVTNTEGNADAVLVRALQPVEGMDVMMRRRNKLNISRITAGPGTVSEALGLKFTDTGSSLLGPLVWLEEQGNYVKESEIVATTRIGVDYAGEDALKPWRYYIRNNPFVSKK